MLFGVVLFAGCAHVTAPERGGAAWVRVTGPHITLTTDLDAASAEREARSLEQLLDAMEQAAWGVRDARVPRERFIVFRSLRSLRAFANASTGHLGLGGGVLINVESYTLEEPGRGIERVTHGEQPLDELDSTRFALAFMVANGVLPKLPWWVRQGTSSYLHSGEVRDSAFEVGELKYDVRKQARGAVDSLHVPRSSHSNTDQAAAFVATYYLRTAFPKEYSDYVRRLVAREPEPEAFAAAFPNLTAEQLRAATSLEGWQQPPVPVAKIPMEPLTSELKLETLPPAEVHALWAALYLGNSPSRSSTDAAREIAEAEALDPNNVSAALLRLRAKGPARETTLLELSAAHPEDVRPCRLLLRDGFSHADTQAAATPDTAPNGAEEQRLACADRLLAADKNDLYGQWERTAALLNLHRRADAEAAMADLDLLQTPDPEMLLALASLQATDRLCPQASATLDRINGLTVSSQPQRVQLVHDVALVRRACAQEIQDGAPAK